MARKTLSSKAGGDLAWKSEDAFVGIFQGRVSKKGKGKKSLKAISFDTQAGTVQKWETKTWADLIEAGDIKKGMALEVAAGDEKKMKGGRRFRPFEITILTGADIPKALKNGLKKK